MSSATVALFKAASSLLERLPERIDVSLARRVARLLGPRLGESARHLRVNVQHAMYRPGAVRDEGLVDDFVARAFASYGHYWAEGAKLPALDPQNVAQRFTISEGLEHLQAASAKGLGVIVALPHVGSWEWGGSFLASIGLPMTAVAEALEPRALFEFFRDKRAAIGINIEPLDEKAGTVLLSTLKAGGVVGLLCDRDIEGNGVEVEFFGERVSIPAGPATLALRTGATLVAGCCYTGPGRDHFAVISPPIAVERTDGRLREDVTRITQDVARELEWLIRRAPEQWHVLQPRFDGAT